MQRGFYASEASLGKRPAEDKKLIGTRGRNFFSLMLDDLEEARDPGTAKYNSLKDDKHAGRGVYTAEMSRIKLHYSAYDASNTEDEDDYEVSLEKEDEDIEEEPEVPPKKETIGSQFIFDYDDDDDDGDTEEDSDSRDSDSPEEP